MLSKRRRLGRSRGLQPQPLGKQCVRGSTAGELGIAVVVVPSRVSNKGFQIFTGGRSLIPEKLDSREPDFKNGFQRAELQKVGIHKSGFQRAGFQRAGLQERRIAEMTDCRLRIPDSSVRTPHSLQTPGSRHQCPESRLQAPAFRFQTPDVNNCTVE